VGQDFCDGVQPEACGDVLVEDALDDRGGERVDRQLVQPLAVGRLARVRVGAGVDEDIAVRRATSEEASLARRFGQPLPIAPGP
jgi:hypothetical protein